MIVQHDLDVVFVAGPGARRARRARAGLSRGHLLRGLPRQERGRRGHAEVLQAVLLPRPHRQPRHAGDAGLHPRRRRAGYSLSHCLRHGLRQPGPDRRLRGRRRRGRDRTARDRLALQQVPESRPRRRRAADPEPERLQDRQPHHPRRASATRSWRRCSSATATRRTSSRAAIRRRCTRRWRRRWSRRSARSAPTRRTARDSKHAVPAALADDRAPLAEGMDRAGGDQGPQGRGLVAVAPGPVLGRARESGQPEAAGGLAAQLQPGGALRRRRAGSGPS